MVSLAIKVVLAAIVAYLVALGADRLERKQEEKKKPKQQKKKNLLVPVVTAVAVVLQVGVIDKVEAWLADPRPRISTQLKETEILLNLEAHNPIATIAIDFPVNGRIVNVHDYNSPADAVTHSKGVRGANVEESLNNVELVLTDIKPDKPLSFKILYEPIKAKVTVEGRDRWLMSYSWMHGGVMNTITKWYLIANGDVVGPPQVQVKDVVIIPRALSDEEIKKDYEQWPRRTILK
jgi:hypothetical protein